LSHDLLTPLPEQEVLEGKDYSGFQARVKLAPQLCHLLCLSQLRDNLSLESGDEGSLDELLVPHRCEVRSLSEVSGQAEGAERVADKSLLSCLPHQLYLQRVGKGSQPVAEKLYFLAAVQLLSDQLSASLMLQSDELLPAPLLERPGQRVSQQVFPSCHCFVLRKLDSLPQ